MRWDYNEDFRDQFGKGPHRDILIVPHATNVIKVSGQPPIVTSKVPRFKNGQPIRIGNDYDYADVEWTITNKDIVKEKFKYDFNLNPADNISFSCAAAAMVQFTIRNNKEYNPDTKQWEQDIPNLQYYYTTNEDGEVVAGELEANAIIKVYTYINADSDSLLCLGMFRVEEDKAVDNGYNRQITAYDFMATFREMDIFNWYKHLFTGINKLDNDYVDATNKSGKETTKPDKYDDDTNWVRRPQKKWTIKNALLDLINNLAAYDMIVYSENGECGIGLTNTNPTTYGRNYGEGNGYSGFGMPVMVDQDILTVGTEPYMPDEPGADEFERYGYMKILELEFMENPKIIQQESLSMGKFLEDIGVLAGRYPFIRADYFDEAGYIDPSSYTGKENRYNNYERCILSFKPLVTSKDDDKLESIPDMTFSNHEIVKGFEHQQFTVEDVMIIKIGIDDGDKIEYKILNKTQRKLNETGELQTFSFSNNLFCSYLVDSSDNEDIKKNLEEYAKIKEKLFGKEKKNGNMTADALFEQGYYNIKNRSYVPFKMSTFADPVRDVGDRIKINFDDKITGEHITFCTYILQRTLEGVQKMMDTYSANGQMTSPVFSNYQAGTKYSSNNAYKQMMLGYKSTVGGGSTGSGITGNDLVSYLRNIGIRLLDEPGEYDAKFMNKYTIETKYVEAENHNGSWDGVDPTEGDTDTHGLMWKNYSSTQTGTQWYDVTKDEPYDVRETEEREFTPIGHEETNAYYIYTLNGNWTKHDVSDVFYHDHDCSCQINEEGDYTNDWIISNWPFDIKPYNLSPGNSTNQLTINGQPFEVQIGDCFLFKDTSYVQPYSVNMMELDAMLNGLDNFSVKDGPYHGGYYSDYTYYNRYKCAWYIEPGVWSTTSGVNDPRHRVLYCNNTSAFTELDADNYVFLTRYYIEPANLAPGDDANQITINGVSTNVRYGMNFKLYGNEYYIGDSGYNDNLSVNIFNNGNWSSYVEESGAIHPDEKGYATYLYPGIWVQTSSYPFSYYWYSEVNRKKISQDAFVELKWTDPSDINTYQPHPATWEGTIVVRKENSPPLNRWDGTLIVDSTDRDQYSEDPYLDKNVSIGKVYYYGFFPYYTSYTEDGHDIKFYRYTAVRKVDSTVDIPIPEITSIQGRSESAIIYYTIPKPNVAYDSIKLYGKLGDPPVGDAESDDICIDLTYGSDRAMVNQLTEGETYYFMIITNEDGVTATSNVMSCFTEDSVTSNYIMMIDNVTGADIIHYDPTITISGNLKQGELYGGRVENGEIISGSEIAWYYDTTKVDYNVIPQNCTVVFEADVMYPYGEGYYDFKCSGDISFYFCFDTKFDPANNRWYHYRLVLTLEDGYVTDQKFYVDSTLIYEGSDNFHPIPSRFPFVNEENSLKVNRFYYTLTRETHLKNIQMYYTGGSPTPPPTPDPPTPPTPTGDDIWTNTSMDNDTAGVFVPTRINSTWLAASGNEIEFGNDGYFNPSHIDTIGTPISLQQYIDIGKGMADNTSMNLPIFNNGVFTIYIGLHKDTNSNHDLSFYYFVNNDFEYGQIAEPVTSADYFYDGEDLKMYLTLVENPAHVEGGQTISVAAGVSRYSTDYYWKSYSAGTGDNRELIYSYIHPNG